MPNIKTLYDFYSFGKQYITILKRKIKIIVLSLVVLDSNNKLAVEKKIH